MIIHLTFYASSNKYFQMSYENCCIMFPNNSTSLILGQSLVSDMCPVDFFIPEGTHEQAAFTCYEEVKLISKPLGVSVNKISDYKQLALYSYIIFPCINVNPRKSTREFGNMLRNLFKYNTIFSYSNNLKLILQENEEKWVHNRARY